MRNGHWWTGSLIVGLGLGLWASVPLAQGQHALTQTPTMGVNDVRDGMKGYGLTVFKGTEPERFDVEVIGVLRNFRPAQDLIIIKTPHPRLNIAKAVRGMSGSPIFLDGKLAGAYSYALAFFSAEPIAGVTPILPMLTELHRPVPPGFWPIDGNAPLPGGAPKDKPRPHASLTTFDGSPGSYDLGAHAKQLADKMGPQTVAGRTATPVATPLLMSGMGDRSMTVASKLFGALGFEPVQGGGGSGPSAGAPMHYVDGGALGVQLARGDVSMMGLGTTTHAVGLKAAGFGHPMMGAGDTAMPTCIGRVHWIMASDQISHKIGECARPLGALVQDRMSAVVVDETKNAPMFPVTVKVNGVQGAPKTQWGVEVTEERFMSPSLVASVYGSVVEATVAEKRDVTWQVHSKVTIRGHGTLDLEDFGVAVGGTPEGPEWFSSRVVRTVGDVLNNPWEVAHVEKIESVMDVQYKREVLRLRGVELLDPIVDVGDPVRVRMRFTTFTGPEEVRVAEVKMPATLAGRDVDIEIVPGYDIPVEVGAPESLNELLSNIGRQTVTAKSIVLQFRVPGVGVTYRNHVADKLPHFALDALRPTNSDILPETFAAFSRTTIPLDKYLDGRDRVRVKVRPMVR